MKSVQRGLLSAIIVLASGAMVMAQAPGGAKGGPKGPPRPVFSVTTTAWPDGGEVPMKYAGRGENMSPPWEFHWSLVNDPTTAPDTLQSYALIFHDVENSSNKTTVDTLHWSAFNIPGTAKGLPRRLVRRRPAGGHSQRSGHCQPWRESWRLFRAGRRTGTDPSLPVRVLRAGYKAGSAGHHIARRFVEGNGRPRHWQSRILWPLPRASAVNRFVPEPRL